jgi:hypothetical protein
VTREKAELLKRFIEENLVGKLVVFVQCFEGTEFLPRVYPNLLLTKVEIHQGRLNQQTLHIRIGRDTYTGLDGPTVTYDPRQIIFTFGAPGWKMHRAIAPDGEYCPSEKDSWPKLKAELQK